LYILGYLVSIFSNLMSMLIVTLGLSGHSNEYQAIVAMIPNSICMYPINDMVRLSQLFSVHMHHAYLLFIMIVVRLEIP
jgi:hypothetical protein